MKKFLAIVAIIVGIFAGQTLAQDEPEAIEAYLNTLNKELLSRLQKSGEAFVSNAVMDGKYVLRACIVNFRTTLDDIEALPKIVVRIGRMLDAELRPEDLRVR